MMPLQNALVISALHIGECGLADSTMRRVQGVLLTLAMLQNIPARTLSTYLFSKCTLQPVYEMCLTGDTRVAHKK